MQEGFQWSMGLKAPEEPPAFYLPPSVPLHNPVDSGGDSESDTALLPKRTVRGGIGCACGPCSLACRLPYLCLCFCGLLRPAAAPQPAPAGQSHDGKRLSFTNRLPCLPVILKMQVVRIVGNARTKQSLLGQTAIVKRAVGLGGWHWLTVRGPGAIRDCWAIGAGVAAPAREPPQCRDPRAPPDCWPPWPALLGAPGTSPGAPNWIGAAAVAFGGLRHGPETWQRDFLPPDRAPAGATHRRGGQAAAQRPGGVGAAKRQ